MSLLLMARFPSTRDHRSVLALQASLKLMFGGRSSEMLAHG